MITGLFLIAICFMVILFGANKKSAITLYYEYDHAKANKKEIEEEPISEASLEEHTLPDIGIPPDIDAAPVFEEDIEIIEEETSPAPASKSTVDSTYSDVEARKAKVYDLLGVAKSRDPNLKAQKAFDKYEAKAEGRK